MSSEDDARRRAEAIEMTREAREEQEQRELATSPIPVSGLSRPVLDLLRQHGDRQALVQLRLVKTGEEWARLEPVERAVVAEWMGRVLGGSPWKAVVPQVFGQRDRRGQWHDAPLPTPKQPDTPESFADLPPVDHARVVALNAFYAAKLGLMHGPPGSGKTTYEAMAIAEISRPNGVWQGRSTIHGDTIVCSEDVDSWADVLREHDADLSRVKIRQWAELPGAVRELTPVAVVVDTLAYVAHLQGAGDLDSAREVDAILRPLQVLARETGAAVTVLDHEPWADGKHGDTKTGTKDRPRHSGAKVATADFILRCTAEKDDHDRIVSITVRPSGVKGARRGIEVRKVTVDLNGEPIDGGAQDDRESTTDRIDVEIRDYLMAHTEGASQRAVERAISGRRATVRERLRVVAEQDENGRWRVRPAGASPTPRAHGAHCAREVRPTPRPIGGAHPGAVRPEGAPRPIGGAPDGAHHLGAPQTVSRGAPETAEAPTDCKTCFGTGRRASGEPCDHMYALRRSFGLPPYGVPADDPGWPAVAALCEGLDGGKGLDELRGIWRGTDDAGRQHFASVVVNVRQTAQRAVDAAATVH